MRTLLLADESVTVQRVIALTFAEQQIKVVSVPDGRQAMEKMAAQKPDIVLAGKTLPHVSGYDLARFMRSKPDLKNIPVLLLTGAFEIVDDAQLAASGANGVLEKPVEPRVVIGRVKELLGLKSDEKPAAAAGRTVTPASQENKVAPEKKLPVPTPPRAVTSTKGTPSRWEQLRNQTGLDADTKSVEDASTRGGDYLDTLDAAFDTLDQHLSGRVPAAKTPRNPAGPLGQSTSAADPRSPGPRGTSVPTPGNPVYEVDDDWFGDTESKARQDAKAGRREIAEDLRDPNLQVPGPKPSPENPIYEVDDEWFAEDEKARAAKAAEQHQLAAEMGIYDVDLPEVPAGDKPAPPADSDFAFGLDDLKGIEAKTEELLTPPKPRTSKVEPPKPAPPVAVAPPTRPVPRRPDAPRIEPPKPPPPVAVAPPPNPAPPAAIAPPPKPAPPAAVAPPIAVAPPTPQAIAPMPAPVTAVADDFAALLAFEQGERKEPPMPPPPEIKVVTPEITEQMLDEIAQRVTDRLTASTFGEQLRNAMTATMRDAVQQTVSGTVGPVVSETSERVVREVVGQTSERVVREVVTATAERAVRDIVAETTERVVRETVSQTVDRVVGDAVSQTTERVVREVVPQTAERMVREVVPPAAERAVREVVTQTTERAVPDAVSQTTERVVREVVPGTAERVVREVVTQTTERAIPDVVAHTTERVVRQVVSETSERLVREEIERIKSRNKS